MPGTPDSVPAALPGALALPLACTVPAMEAVATSLRRAVPVALAAAVAVAGRPVSEGMRAVAEAEAALARLPLPLPLLLGWRADAEAVGKAAVGVVEGQGVLAALGTSLEALGLLLREGLCVGVQDSVGDRVVEALTAREAVAFPGLTEAQAEAEEQLEGEGEPLASWLGGAERDTEMEGVLRALLGALRVAEGEADPPPAPFSLPALKDTEALVLGLALRLASLWLAEVLREGRGERELLLSPLLLPLAEAQAETLREALLLALLPPEREREAEAVSEALPLALPLTDPLTLG